MKMFSDKDRVKAMKVRKRNALLRKQGKLPPVKTSKSKAVVQSIPLEAIPQRLTPKAAYKTKNRTDLETKQGALRVLAMIAMTIDKIIS